MREGVLLAESPPTSLMAKYNFDTLEDVFLHLSQKQHNEQTKIIKVRPIHILTFSYHSIL